jgi:hypothetical protein
LSKLSGLSCCGLGMPNIVVRWMTAGRPKDAMRCHDRTRAVTGASHRSRIFSTRRNPYWIYACQPHVALGMSCLAHPWAGLMVIALVGFTPLQTGSTQSAGQGRDRTLQANRWRLHVSATTGTRRVRTRLDARLLPICCPSEPESHDSFPFSSPGR